MVLSIKQRAGVAHTLTHRRQGTELPEHEKVKQKLKGTEQSVHLPHTCVHTHMCLLEAAGAIAQADGDGNGLSSVSCSATCLGTNAVTATQRTKSTVQQTCSSTTASFCEVWVLQEGKKPLLHLLLFPHLRTSYFVI